MPMTRRTALATLGMTLASAPAILRRRYRLFAGVDAEYSARAVGLVQSSTVVDLLNQFQFRDYSVKPPAIEQWLTRPGTFTAEDIVRYRESGITVFALGSGPDSYERAIRYFADWNGFLAGYSDWVTRIDDALDFARAKAQRKVGVMLTYQNSAHFRTPDDVETFFGLGQRISQLTYNFDNKIGSGFLENRDGGLSVFGLSILERMEQTGMAVDVSHCGDQTTLDALAAAKKPVLITHGNARALVPGHLRCKTDEAIQKMAKTGGVMGISMIRFMVRAEEPVTIDHVLDHVDYVSKLVGVEHVGIGSDLDVVGNANDIGGGGFDPTTQPNFSRYQYHAGPDGRINIKGLDHPKRVFDFTEGLIRRGYKDGDVRLILGENAVRALGQIWPT
jgi:membrane dipeptidase